MIKFLLKMFTWWNGNTIGTGLFTLLRGEAVGRDDDGNRYYRERKGSRRWVIYNGVVEASRIPPDWHAWLHYLSDKPPTEKPLPGRDWEQPHQANMTGTGAAWFPPGSLRAGGQRPPVSGDYEAWHPRAADDRS